jgi:hypothetical protein
MTFDEWRDTHWKWGSSTDEAKALRAWNSAREDQDAEIERLKKVIERQKEALNRWAESCNCEQREATKDE